MRWWSRRGSLDDFFDGLGPRRRRPHVLVVLLLTVARWRRELALVGGSVWSLQALAATTHPVAAGAMALVGLVAAFVWEPGRRVLAERATAVAMEHRLRVGMSEAGIVTWSGRLPALLAARPVTRGVRILVWCPAGVDAIAFLANRELLAAACWAVDIEVRRHPKRVHLLHVLVVTAPEPQGEGR
jgi:hypothetical protein